MHSYTNEEDEEKKQDQEQEQDKMIIDPLWSCNQPSKFSIFATARRLREDKSHSNRLFIQVLILNNAN